MTIVWVQKLSFETCDLKKIETTKKKLIENEQ